MILTLTAEQAKFISERMNKSGYSSPEEVVDEGLKLIQAKEDYERRLARLRSDLQVGIDQINRGEVVNGREAIAQLREKIQNRSRG